MQLGDGPQNHPSPVKTPIPLAGQVDSQFGIIAYSFEPTHPRNASTRRGTTMLKGLDPLLTADLLWVLRAMGHGDEIVLCDTNYPAQNAAGSRKLIVLPGVDACRIAQAILSVMPLDTFVDAPAMYMAAPERQPVHAEMQEVVSKLTEFPVTLAPVERFAFYERAKQAFSLIATGETRLYANFIFKKGVIPPSGNR
jgi:L-fucose mutarotase